MQKKNFRSCQRDCDQRLIVVIVYYFQNWNKKEYIIIIISRVISSYMGPMYIETLKKGLWSKIDSCYSILFSKLKQKRTYYH